MHSDRDIEFLRLTPENVVGGVVEPGRIKTALKLSFLTTRRISITAAPTS
jgi:hypothetical protein